MLDCFFPPASTALLPFLASSASRIQRMTGDRDSCSNTQRARAQHRRARATPQQCPYFCLPSELLHQLLPSQEGFVTSFPLSFKPHCWLWGIGHPRGPVPALLFFFSLFPGGPVRFNQLVFACCCFAH